MAYVLTGLVCLLVGVFGGGYLCYLYADKVVAKVTAKYEQGKQVAGAVVADVKKVL